MVWNQAEGVVLICCASFSIVRLELCELLCFDSGWRAPPQNATACVCQTAPGRRTEIPLGDAYSEEENAEDAVQPTPGISTMKRGYLDY